MSVGNTAVRTTVCEPKFFFETYHKLWFTAIPTLRIEELLLRHPDAPIGIGICPSCVCLSWSLTGQHMCAYFTIPALVSDPGTKNKQDTSFFNTWRFYKFVYNWAHTFAEAVCKPFQLICVSPKSVCNNTAPCTTSSDCQLHLIWIKCRLNGKMTYMYLCMSVCSGSK